MKRNQLPVLINARARSVPVDAEQQVAALTRQSDVEFQPVNVKPEDMASAIAKASDDYSEIAVWGGDGTIACALSESKESTRVLPLPGGTMNLLHKSIHGGDFDPEVLLREYAKGTLAESEIPVARVNGHRFYVGIICGHLAELASVREALREGKPITAMSDLFASSSFDLSDKLTARFQYHGVDTQTKTDSVALAVFLRSGQSAPFEIGALNADSIFDMTTTALEALLEGWENAASIDSLHADKIRISSPLEEASVTIDGELHQLTSPIVVERDDEETAKVFACSIT